MTSDAAGMQRLGSQTDRIPPFAAEELEVVAVAIAEAELVAEHELDSGADMKRLRSGSLTEFQRFNICHFENPRFLNLASR